MKHLSVLVLVAITFESSLAWDAGQCIGSREERLKALGVLIPRIKSYIREKGAFPNLLIENFPQITSNLPGNLKGALILTDSEEKSVGYSCRLGNKGGGETCELNIWNLAQWCRTMESNI